jgi:hypothetical protein
MKLYIPQQFIADTMCQPITIILSYKALVAPGLTIKAFFYVHKGKWETLINITPGIYSQICGGGSDLGLRIPEGRELIFSLLRNAFQIFSTRQHKFTVERITIAKFRRKTNFNQSVVLFRIHDDDARQNEFKGHFFCAVDYDKQNVLLQCSAAIYDGSEPYIEKLSPIGRYFNDVLPVHSISPNYIKIKQIFEITLVQ